MQCDANFNHLKISKGDIKFSSSVCCDWEGTVGVYIMP